MKSGNAQKLFVVDFHAMPLYEARKVYFKELDRARELGYGGLLLQHGHRNGTAIRNSLRRTASGQYRSGKIKAVIPGEKFGPFTEDGRVSTEVMKLTDSFSWVRSNQEWSKSNAGITV